MSVTATIKQSISVVEQITSFGVQSTNNGATFALNTDAILTAISTVPATKHAAFEKLLTAGAATIDLTNLTGPAGAVVSGSGLRVQAIMFRAKADNANPITITPGASNGYNLGGSGFSCTLKAGDCALFTYQDSNPDIDGTHKTLDLAGTGTQGLECLIVMG